MPKLLLIDHVAITVADLEASCAFYARLFGAEVVLDAKDPEGRPRVRGLRIGGGVQINVHQAGNGLSLVADRPTPGSVDICFRWGGTIAEAAALLREHGLAVIEGPAPRLTNDGRKAQSVYFHDPDRNLLELMAAD